MPLAKFIAQAMEILKVRSTPHEICVEAVKPLRFAAENGRFDAVFEGMNSALADIH